MATVVALCLKQSFGPAQVGCKLLLLSYSRNDSKEHTKHHWPIYNASSGFPGAIWPHNTAAEYGEANPSELVSIPYQCSSLNCAHAFQCEGLQNNHTSLQLSNFFETLHKGNLDIGRFVLNVKALNKMCAMKKRCWKWTFMLEMMMSE